MNTTIDISSIITNLENGDYPLLGSGSGRRVHDLHNDTALKIARNVRGYAQNQIEYIISEMDDSQLFAKVLYSSPDNHYLIMEKALPITNFALVRSYFKVNTNQELFRLNDFRYIPQKYNLIISDLCRPANWGMLHERPVILDYGFTGRIRRKYYSIL